MTYERYEAVYNDGRKVFLWHVDGVHTGYEVDLNGERWEVEDAAGLWWDLIVWQGLMAGYYPGCAYQFIENMRFEDGELVAGETWKARR